MSRIIKFAARDVDGDDEGFALTVGFVRDSNDEHTDDGLMLQRAKEDDSGDQGIYAEVPIQRYASYGGIKEAALARPHFSVKFAPETARDFADISGMEISFELPPKSSKGLPRYFSGFSATMMASKSKRNSVRFELRQLVKRSPMKIALLAVAIVTIVSPSPSGAAPENVAELPQKLPYQVKVSQADGKIKIFPSDAPDKDLILKVVRQLAPLKDGENITLAVIQKEKGVSLKKIESVPPTVVWAPEKLLKPEPPYEVKVTRSGSKIEVSPDDAPDRALIIDFVRDLELLKDGETMQLSVQRKGGDITFKPLDGRKVNVPKSAKAPEAPTRSVTPPAAQEAHRR